jgi:hypothetical protein
LANTHGALEANSEKIARFSSEFYVEEMDSAINDVDAAK